MNSLPLEAVANIFSGNSINAKLKKDKYTDKNFPTPYVATKDLSKNGDIEYNNGVTIPDAELGNFKIAPKGTTLICIEGGSAGKKIGLVDKDVCFVNKLGALVPNEKINSRYLYYSLQTVGFQAQFQASLTGIIGGVSLSKLKKLKIPVPSLQEQEKIVERLNKTYEINSKFFKVMKTKQKLFKTLKLAGELNIVDSFQSTEYKLDEICTLITDGTHHTPTYTKEGIPFLSVKNITNGKVDFNNTKYVSRNEHNKLVKRCDPELGDILYSKVGTTGVAQMINTDKEFSIFVSLALLKVDKSIVMPELLQYLLNTSYVYKQAQDRTKGVANRNLVLREIKEIMVKFPKKEQEQRKLLKKLKEFNVQLNNLEANNELGSDQFSLLCNSILNKEFSYE